MSRQKTLLVCAIGALAIGAAASAGDLTPPGAPAPTMKTLDQVEPRTPLTQETAPGDADSVFRITQPGSYYLVENLFAPSGFQGVEIAIGNVTLDLSGFTIAGDVGSLAGISAAGGASNIVLRNGFVQDMGASGVQLSGSMCAVEGLHALRNGNYGIEAIGNSSRVEDCIARDNVSRGIYTGTNAVVRDCAASGNGSEGIYLNSASVAAGCVTYQNGGTGISTGSQGQLSDCSSRFNGVGFATGFGAVIRNCTARDNTATGFALGSRSILVGAAAYSNGGDGVITGSDCSVLDSTIASNSGAGINAASATTINGCNVSSNNGVGIDIQLAGVVRETRLSGNAVGGVVARGQCLLDRVHIARNGTATGGNGVELFGGENVVRQCVLVGNGASISFGGSDVLDDNNILANP